MVEVTVCDGWPDEALSNSIEPRILVQLAHENFLGIGDHITLPNGTPVVVTQAEQTGNVSQTVHVVRVYSRQQ
jgi:hypothetical protein